MNPFSIQHFIYISLLIPLFFMMIQLNRYRTDSKQHRIFRYAVVITLIVTKGLWVLYKQKFPLHLCDFSLVCVSLGLIWPKNRILCNISYYIGIPGVIIAVVFPDISETGAIQQIAALRYFITHYAILLGGLYLTFGQKYFPKTKDLIQTFLIFLGYTTFSAAVNKFFGTNYMYLSQRPDSAKFLEIIPQQFYIFIVIVFSFLVFWCLQIPFAKRSRHQK